MEIIMSKITSIANALVESGALKFGKFTIKSGIISPYYIDLTLLLSSPQDFESVVDVVVDEIRMILASQKVDQLASIALKGALFIPSIANKLDLPCVVVRKESKKYGVTGRIAGGDIEQDEHILFFDDVVSSGQSKLEGIKPLEQLGAKVDMVMVVVDREQGGRENLERHGYQVYALTTISELVKSLLENRKISKRESELITEYIKSSYRT
jgi:uridine monophosphate synthetase